jgi:hypothetical protein
MIKCEGDAWELQEEQEKIEELRRREKQQQQEPCRDGDTRAHTEGHPARKREAGKEGKEGPAISGRNTHSHPHPYPHTETPHTEKINRTTEETRRNERAFRKFRKY